MRGLRQLLLVNLRLYLREPIMTFFTLAFPPLLVILFGAIYGNEPSDLFGGRGSMDISMPGYTALILGSVGFMGVPITLSGYRETGVLRRFRAAGVPAAAYIVSDVVVNLIMTLLGMAALLVFGWALYRVRFEGQPLLFLAAVILSGLAMFAVGYLIASVAPSARTAQVVSMAVFYPMMFLSGAGLPLEILPPSVRTFSNILPLTYVTTLLRGAWFGEPLGRHLLEVSVLAAVLVVCTAASARLFRWE